MIRRSFTAAVLLAVFTVPTLGRATAAGAETVILSEAQAATGSVPTILLPPGAISATASFVNDRGTVGGTYVTPIGLSAGYLYRNGNYELLDQSGEAVGLVGLASNDTVALSGSVGGPLNPDHVKYVYRDGIYSPVPQHPVYLTPGNRSLRLTGINSRGDILANLRQCLSCIQSTVTLFSNGSWSTVASGSEPSAALSEDGSVAWSMSFGLSGSLVYLSSTAITPPGYVSGRLVGTSDSGLVAANYLDGFGVERGFMYARSLSAFIPFSPPGSISSKLISIAPNGLVIGSDQSGQLWTLRAGTYTSVSLPSSLESVSITDLSSDGTIVGTSTGRAFVLPSQATVDDAAFTFQPVTTSAGQEATAWVKYGPNLPAAFGDYLLGNHTTKLAGATAQFYFSGSQFSLYGARGPAYGRFSVSVDGGTPFVVDSFAPSPTKRQSVLFVSPLLFAGGHSVSVTVLGTKNPSSSDSFVVLDKAVVIGEGDPIQGPPNDVPRYLDTQVTQGSVRVRWTDQASNEAGYLVYRVSGTNIALVPGCPTMAPNLTECLDSGLAAGTPYQYYVYAWNSHGTAYSGTYLNARTLDSLPAAPFLVSATATGPTTVRLRWTDNASDEAGFRVYRYVGANRNLLGTFAPDTTEAVVSDSTLNTAIESPIFVVAAFNNSGEQQSPGYIFSLVRSAPSGQVTPPSDLRVRKVSPSGTLIEWTDNAANELGYLVYRVDANGQTLLACSTTTPNLTSCTDQAGASSDFVQFHVYAWNSSGTGYAGTGTIVRQGVDLQPPRLTAVTGGLSSAQVSWQLVPNATAYRVYKYLNGAYTLVGTTGEGASNLRVDSLTPGSTHVFVVSAVLSSLFSSVPLRETFSQSALWATAT